MEADYDDLLGSLTLHSTFSIIVAFFAGLNPAYCFFSKKSAAINVWAFASTLALTKVKCD